MIHFVRDATLNSYWSIIQRYICTQLPFKIHGAKDKKICSIKLLVCMKLNTKY
jgi:hypothetical protein